MYIWRKRTNSKPASVSSRSSSRTSWEMVKDLMVDADKMDLFAERAEILLNSLKQRFPGLPQTALDMSKIQYNKVCLYDPTLLTLRLIFELPGPPPPENRRIKTKIEKSKAVFLYLEI